MKKNTVLVIEDNELNMKLVRTIMEREGIHMLEAEDALMGIGLARKYQPDLILMDIQLPGMDGLKATRTLKDYPELSHIPVLALSGHAMKSDEQAAMDAGCSGYITKPIRIHDFIEKLTSFLKQDESSGEDPVDSNLQRSKILIVDDEPLNLKILAAKLASDKYEVIMADHGMEALEKASQLLPDLVLLDVMMPEMDGYEVARRLKDDPRTNRIPIIMVTALDGVDNKIKALEVGADEFLNKPVNKHELSARVNSMISLKKCQDRLIACFEHENVFTLPSDEDILYEVHKNPISILCIEDQEIDVKLIFSYLHDEPYVITHVRNGDEAIKILEQQRFDLVLLDLLLPDMDGFEICREVKKMELGESIQIVVVTCLQELESKVKCLELGADDYLIKPIHPRELKLRLRTLLKKSAYMKMLQSQPSCG